VNFFALAPAADLLACSIKILYWKKTGKVVIINSVENLPFFKRTAERSRT